ncbi:galactonate dehydratase [Rudaea cellulosilytica]|uniref:galactonate dehydratase n=1 Tax=Rudaea cellulosilytica TaxID=540746 RepID=UPI000380122C|nr:galactonate dehydratase [Rudaea cellulosilytica]
MKITDVKTVVVNAEMRNWVFTKVETDVPGLFGWGEASLEWKTRSLVGTIEDMKQMVLGEDPRNIEHIYQKMYRQSFWRMGVIGMSAISSIEQALWDIAGKDLGVPVYRLLGGKVRDKVRMYTHLGGGNMKAVYETFEVEPLIELAQQCVANGYTAIKVVFVPYSEPLEGPATVKRFAHMFGTLREAMGDNIDIMVDFHGRTYPAMAIQYINAIEEFHPYFCEEPVPPENVPALLEVRQSTRVPIATGERLVSRHQFREVFEQRACHVIQPDLCHCGGLLEAKKIAAMAEMYQMGVAPHNPLGPVANAAALHFALSTPNFLIQEDMLTDVPWRWDVVKSDLQTKNGYWLPCETPGLGIEVDEKAAAKHPFKQEVMHSLTIRAKDGAVLDW